MDSTMAAQENSTPSKGSDLIKMALFGTKYNHNITSSIPPRPKLLRTLNITEWGKGKDDIIAGKAEVITDQFVGDYNDLGVTGVCLRGTPPCSKWLHQSIT